LTVLPAQGSHLLWYVSLNSSGTASVPVIPAGQTDPFVVYVTQTIDGCESPKASLQVNFYEKPQVQLPADTTFCTGDVMNLGYRFNAAATYQWSSGETTPYIRPVVPGTYQLTVSNLCGSATAATRVQTVPCDHCFWLPDAFTPNGDGRNDLFGPVRTCPAHFHYFLFRIYNRWGQVVFESVSPDHKWDGSFAGQTQPMGTYTYTLGYRSTAIAPVVFLKGTVELVR
jgi:gliding motility-associated-like protein